MNSWFSPPKILFDNRAVNENNGPLRSCSRISKSLTLSRCLSVSRRCWIGTWSLIPWAIEISSATILLSHPLTAQSPESWRRRRLRSNRNFGRPSTVHVFFVTVIYKLRHVCTYILNIPLYSAWPIFYVLKVRRDQKIRNVVYNRITIVYRISL